MSTNKICANGVLCVPNTLDFNNDGLDLGTYLQYRLLEDIEVLSDNGVLYVYLTLLTLFRFGYIFAI